MDIGIFRYTPTVDGAVGEVRRAADQGFGSFWIPQIFGLDALTAMAVIAREVPEIELGTGVVPVYRQHPMALAQQALTVSQVNDGRIALGIGLSHQIVVETMWGLSYDRPLRYMREYLAALVPLLEGDQVAAGGEVVMAMGAVDVVAPRPDVLVAALGPRMLELTGREADGTITWMVGPRTLADHVTPTITQAAADAGRPPPRIVVSLPVCVSDRPTEARERAAKEFVMYGTLPSYRAMLDREGAAGPEDLALIGSADEVADHLETVAEAGATGFAASEFGTPDEQAATRELLVSLL